jgi:glycosyltransferase involved in cell wall biosynthesis
MACGIPVVITDVAANSEWVEHGKQGFLVRTRDAQMLGEKIARLLESPDLRTRLGRAARQVIVERNNLQKEMLKMEGLYQELCKVRGIRGAPHTSSHSDRNRRVEMSTK